MDPNLFFNVLRLAFEVIKYVDDRNRKDDELAKKDQGKLVKRRKEK